MEPFVPGAQESKNAATFFYIDSVYFICQALDNRKKGVFAEKATYVHKLSFGHHFLAIVSVHCVAVNSFLSNESAPVVTQIIILHLRLVINRLKK